MSATLTVLASAQDLLAAPAPAANPVRAGFQTLFGAIVVCLAIYAALHVHKVGHLLMAIAAAVVGATIAFATEAQWQAIGGGGAGVLAWGAGLFA